MLISPFLTLQMSGSVEACISSFLSVKTSFFFALSTGGFSCPQRKSKLFPINIILSHLVLSFFFFFSSPTYPPLRCLRRWKKQMRTQEESVSVCVLHSWQMSMLRRAECKHRGAIFIIFTASLNSSWHKAWCPAWCCLNDSHTHIMFLFSQGHWLPFIFHSFRLPKGPHILGCTSLRRGLHALKVGSKQESAGPACANVNPYNPRILCVAL